MTPTSDLSGGDWTDQVRRLLGAIRAAGASGPAEQPAGGTDCRWCPLCQAAAVARGERPEVTAALADLLTTTAAALRQFAGESAPAPSSDAEPAAAPPDSGVQRIHLT